MLEEPIIPSTGEVDDELEIEHSPFLGSTKPYRDVLDDLSRSGSVSCVKPLRANPALQRPLNFRRAALKAASPIAASEIQWPANGITFDGCITLIGPFLATGQASMNLVHVISYLLPSTPHHVTVLTFAD